MSSGDLSSGDLSSEVKLGVAAPGGGELGRIERIELRGGIGGCGAWGGESSELSSEVECRMRRLGRRIERIELRGGMQDAAPEGGD